jgi:hypothetical protein
MEFRRWLEDSESNAERYFGIGHGDYDEDEGFEPSYIVWAYIGGRIEASDEVSIDPETGRESEGGGTHGSLWGHGICDRNFKGRFEPETKRLSIVKPCSDRTERYGNPESFIQAILLPELEKKFGKLDPRKIEVF